MKSNSRKRLLITSALVLGLSWLFLPPEPVAGYKMQRVASTPTPTPQPDTSVKPDLNPAIPFSQIVTRSEDLKTRVEKISNQLSLDQELTALEATLDAQQPLIEGRLRETEQLLTAVFDLSELNELENDWRSLRDQYAGLNKILDARMQTAEDNIRYIESEELEWEITLQQVQKDSTLQAVSTKALDALEVIKEVRPELKANINTLLAQQKKLSQLNETVTTTLGKISDGKKQFRHSLWVPDGPPLWKVGRQTDSHSIVALSKSLYPHWVRAKKFVLANLALSLAPVFLFLALLVIALVSHRRVRRWAELYPDTIEPLAFLKYPISLSLLATLSMTLPFTEDVPTLFKTLVILLFIVPILRFAPLFIQAAFRLPLYALIFFGLAMAIWDLVRTSPLIKLSGIAVLTLLAALFIGWLFRRGQRQLTRPVTGTIRLVIYASYTGLFLLFFSFAAILFGYILLAQVLRTGSVFAAYYAVALFASFVLITSIVSILWQLRQGKASSSLRHYEPLIAKWGRLLLIFVAFIFWLSQTLKIFGMRESVVNALTITLTYEISLGAVKFSLSDVLTFILLFLLGIFIASATKVILREDVLVKFHLKQGLPYAISTIAYYVLLLLGFIFALAAAGVELSKFAILTGAFGVGLGFGLQNIINNFVSGIILLFERPIRIGDLAEAGGVTGEVVRIGTRSSSLRTAQGAVVLVPNSNLISDQVVNWSLAAKHRRVEISFKAAYGSDPAEVIKVIADAAATHPEVSTAPKPLGLFLGYGYGESALEFELHFWAPLVLLPQLKSEVALRVSTALQEAGIVVPLPQRELLVKNYDSVPGSPSAERVKEN